MFCISCGKQLTSIWWLGNQPYKETKEKANKDYKQEKTSIPLRPPLNIFHLTHLLGSMFSKCFAIEIGEPRTTLCGTPDAPTLYKRFLYISSSAPPHKTMYAHMIRHHTVIVTPLFSEKRGIRPFTQLCHCRWLFAETAHWSFTVKLLDIFCFSISPRLLTSHSSTIR